MKTKLLLSLSLLFQVVNAFDINHLLAQKPSLSRFNDYINLYTMAGDINARHPITVLAVDNQAVSLLTGKPTSVISKILELHVLLDYYDMPKLLNMPNGTANVATLFQESGLAVGDQGMLKATKLSTNAITFSSGPSGGGGHNVRAYVVNSIVSLPNEVSILQISNLIVPPGMEGPAATNPSINPTSPPPASKIEPIPSHDKTPNASTSQSTKAPLPSPPNAPGSTSPPSTPSPSHENVPGSPQSPNAPANAPGSHLPPKAPAPSRTNESSSALPPKAHAPSNASVPGSPLPPKAPSPSPSSVNATGSPQPSKADPPSHTNATGSPRHPEAPTPSHANAPSSSETANSPSPSQVGEPEFTPTPTESPDEISYGVRVTSNISLNVLATRLLILAILWMI